MKTFILIIAALALTVPASQAQNAQSAGKRNVELRTTAKGAELMATQPARPKPSLKPEEGKVQYGGFLVEVAKPKRPVLTEVVGKPVTENADSPNVMRDPVTGRIRGFVFFAIRF